MPALKAFSAAVWSCRILCTIEAPSKTVLGKSLLAVMGLRMSEQASGQLTQKELREFRRLKMVREALDELKRKGITADLPICPNCKSPRVIDMTSSRDLGFIGSFHPAYYCLDCGWYGRVLTIMSNRPEKDAVLEDLKGAFAPLMDPDETDFLTEIEESLDEGI